MSGAPHHPSIDRERGPVLDLTDGGPTGGGWLTASTGVDHVQRPTRRRRRRGEGDPGRAVPKGQKHAYRAGQATTGCGVRLTDLHAWDEPFGDGLLNRCPACLSQVRRDLAAASHA